MATALYANGILDIAASALWAATVELSNRVQANAPLDQLQTAQRVHSNADKNMADAVRLYLKFLFRESQGR